MKTTDKKKRSEELSESLAYQEMLLNLGANRLQELNKKYEDLEREYKILLIKKKELTESIITLTENLDLYSNF